MRHSVLLLIFLFPAEIMRPASLPGLCLLLMFKANLGLHAGKEAGLTKQQLKAKQKELQGERKALAMDIPGYMSVHVRSQAVVKLKKNN